MRKTISNVRACVRKGQVILTWYKSTPTFQAKDAEPFGTFRIYRRKEDGFVFGEDYGEYFSGMTPDGAERIYEGALTPSNNRKFAFSDTGVEIGATYVYFVQAGNTPIVGPVPVRVRDAEVWWPYDVLRKRIEALSAIAPELVRVGSCGYTSAGRDIFRVDVGHGDRVLGLVGLIHGGEAGPELIVPALSHLIKTRPDVFAHVRVVAIPSVNADAREQEANGVPWYVRTTPGGVDLNRNFPADWGETEYGYGLDSSDVDSDTFRGFAVQCAPETQAVIRAFTQTRPDVVFSFHCLAGICGMPALASRKGQTDRVYADRCRTLAQHYASGLYPETPFEDRWLQFGTSAGSLPTWLYNLGGIPAFDLEGRRDGGEAACITDRTDRALVTDYQQRHARAIAEVIAGLA